MRRVPVPLILPALLPLALPLAGCFGPPHADMTATAPPGAGRSHTHTRPLPSDMAYVRDVRPPMPMPPGAVSADSQPPKHAADNAPPDEAADTSPGFSAGPGGMGTSPGATDITPRAAIPDTEVSYGKNGGN